MKANELTYEQISNIGTATWNVSESLSHKYGVLIGKTDESQVVCLVVKEKKTNTILLKFPIKELNQKFLNQVIDFMKEY